MKIKIKHLEECTKLFDIEVPEESVEKALDEVYDEITKVANIPGFRAGKAPKELVKKHYAKNAREEVLQRLIPEAYKAALEEHKIKPASMPEISEVKFEDDKILSFKAKVDTRPDFKLKSYKGIEVKKKKVKITDEEVNKTLEKLSEMYAKYVAVEDRPLQMGDYAVSDLECFVDSKPIHKKRENLWLLLEKESLIPGLSDKMVGMNKGEERDIEAVLPEKYPDKNLAGKKAVYHVKVKEIKLRQLPKIDDDFAKDVGKSNLEELKKEITKELEVRSMMVQRSDVEAQLLTKLIDDNVFNVPAGFVSRQLAFMVEDSKRHLLEKGFKKEDLDKKDEEFKEKFKNDAVRRIRLLFILDEIARIENISVTEEDVKVAYRSIAAQTGRKEDEVKAHYEKEDLVDDLKEQLREGKTIEFLLKESRIVEVES